MTIGQILVNNYKLEDDMYINHYILGLGMIFVRQGQLSLEFKERSYHLQKDQEGFHGKADKWAGHPRLYSKTSDKEWRGVLVEEYKKRNSKWKK